MESSSEDILFVSFIILNMLKNSYSDGEVQDSVLLLK